MFLQQLVSYLCALKRADSLSLVACVQRALFDETPLRMRIAFEADTDLQLAKVIGAEMRYGFLVQEKHVAEPELIYIHGRCSPSVRATDRSTGEGLAAVTMAQ